MEYSYYFVYFNSSSGTDGHVLSGCVPDGNWMMPVDFSVGNGLILTWAKDKQRQYIEGLLSLETDYKGLLQYVMRAKLCGLPVEYVTLVYDDRPINILDFSYDDLFKETILVSGSALYDETDIEDIIIKRFRRDVELDRRNRIYSYWYNFEKKHWLIISRIDDKLYIQIEKYGVSEPYEYCIDSVSRITGVTLDSISSETGIDFKEDKFFRVSVFFFIAMQVYIKDPSKLKYLSDDIINHEASSKTDLDMSKFSVLGELVLNAGLLQWCVDCEIPSDLQLSVSNGSWKDPKTQENVLNLLNNKEI